MAITMDARDGYARAGSPLGAAAEDGRVRAFQRARRHSLLVRTLRLALPIGAVGLAAFYALTLGVSWRLGAGRLNVGEVQLTAMLPAETALPAPGDAIRVRPRLAEAHWFDEQGVRLGTT